ncbi:4-hydroxy-3-methylbut-2-enyl diphosphate reductase [Candidatus Sumerlaeota bacterium]|nr:4-hydroxy-3-methylbut-2-enyl diphosphate reductase [Candidatus Sumerlaeota bacterium]
MVRDPGLIRRSFGLQKEIEPTLQSQYHSELIEAIKRNEYHIVFGEYEVFLAREFGFCYGVDRAVNLAYETRRQFPNRRIIITHEIIHNPRVNQNLKDMGVEFMTGAAPDDSRWDAVGANDVVLLPAFGASAELTERLKATGATIVDTTCGSVMNVWRRVQTYQREGYTAIIHGKHSHEETIATKSRAGKYIVVLDMRQVDMLCDYIEGRGGREAFLREFEERCSPGFDPDADLKKVGIANQTTMLSSESLAIAGRVQQSIEHRYGSAEGHFRRFDTICSATQDRQDAMQEMLKRDLDLMLVVGGFNSSNTAHLLEIALQSCPAYHIYDATCIESLTRIQHSPLNSKQAAHTEDWFPSGARKIGFTAGASTPNSITGNCIKRTLELLGVTPIESAHLR